KFLDTFFFPDPSWLVNLNSMPKSRLLDRRKLHFLSSSLRLVRLCHRKDNLMSCLKKRLQCSDGKIRCSHKNDFHTLSQSFLFFFRCIVMDAVFCKTHVHQAGEMINLMTECSCKEAFSHPDDFFHVLVERPHF